MAECRPGGGGGSGGGGRLFPPFVSDPPSETSGRKLGQILPLHRVNLLLILCGSMLLCSGIMLLGKLTRTFDAAFSS
jgi:hypothetical protein